jgi:FO synthase subunit 1
MIRQIAVTYSPAYTLVPTYECFNRCSYCNFRVNPGQDTWLFLEKAEEILKKLQSQKICEILILSGEVHPQSPRRNAWFRQIYDLCNLAISLGFLPHTNAGPLTFTEMKQLKSVNASMGLMLEQLTTKLLETVHRHAPSKIPQRRLQQLNWAGELRIPFTTGLLLGIGETTTDRWETLTAIAQIHQRWGHIQEVILQPHSPGQQQAFAGVPFDLKQLPDIVAKAREILPPAIAIQIPPNLVGEPKILLDCLAAGARDLGGISIHDEVNPDYPHPQIQSLAQILEPRGWQLCPRLPVYPQYQDWLSPSLQAITAYQLSVIGEYR